MSSLTVSSCDWVLQGNPTDTFYLTGAWSSALLTSAAKISFSLFTVESHTSVHQQPKRFQKQRPLEQLSLACVDILSRASFATKTVCFRATSFLTNVSAYLDQTTPCLIALPVRLVVVQLTLFFSDMAVSTLLFV